MKYGYYSDNKLPEGYFNKDYRVNQDGYRCNEFLPLPNGGKNAVVLGCSHTFGQALDDGDVWVDQLANLTKSNVRFWNLGQPGSSGDKMVRILYASEKVLFPKIIIMCWPVISRREKLDKIPINLTSDAKELGHENEHTDLNNFYKNFFLVEKFADFIQAKTFHCFSDDAVDVDHPRCYTDYTLKTCYPVWDKHNLPGAIKSRNQKPSYAKDGIHYGVEHHSRFANLLHQRWISDLR